MTIENPHCNPELSPLITLVLSDHILVNAQVKYGKIPVGKAEIDCVSTLWSMSQNKACNEILFCGELGRVSATEAVNISSITLRPTTEVTYSFVDGSHMWQQLPPSSSCVTQSKEFFWLPKYPPHSSSWIWRAEEPTAQEQPWSNEGQDLAHEYFIYLPFREAIPVCVPRRF